MIPVIIVLHENGAVENDKSNHFKELVQLPRQIKPGVF